MLFAAQDDIVNKLVVDLGCGTGILGIGAVILGAAHVVGVDVDAAAIEKARVNACDAETDVDFVLADALASPPWAFAQAGRLADTVVMNPPFGTRKAGADVEFLRAGLNLCRGAVYSMHKTSTRDFIVNKCSAEWGMDVKVVAQLKFDVPASYAFHKKKSADVDVDLIRVAHRYNVL